ncbi:MAG: hypothetical protein BIP78_1589 [Candidatus Bipolaricaulis sibiricus]|uniref:C4-type zinc ribbon domain-containing protein n=1 Tax=Bipolaricaulis sibiricus TaxID=2501609 RepID=A0A410FWF6_BIPS1|nr:MAG: hypothetical protein BIP78_1589 [Candidatus Bipolaricaulis sibiricus]
MTDALSRLLELAEADAYLRVLDGRLSDLEREEKHLHERLTLEDEEFKRRQETNRALRLSALAKTGEVDATDERIRSYQHKLDHDIIPYKEMEYLREQVALLRERLDELATEALQLMADADADDGALRVESDEHAVRRGRLEDELAAVADRRAATLAEREALRVRRQGLLQSVPAHLRGHYERLLAGGGSPVVPVVAGVCGGCHLRLAETTVEKVKAGREVVTCEHCSRFLYLRPA